MSSIRILATGPLCTVQDRGRPGYAHIGVGRSGAADMRAHDTANRLVGNTIEAASLEATLGGLRICAEGTLLVCVTGAPTPVAVNGVADGMYAAIALADGDELTIGTAFSGLRTYLTVRGGIGVESVLGSRSTDMMAGLGPPPLAAGDVLPVGDEASEWPATTWAPPPADSGPFHVVLGPRDDWFADPVALFTHEWTVTSDADRVGVRLDGAATLERSNTAELPSEGMVVGAVQVPPDGKPVVFLADHPVTGGYPVIGVVSTADLPRLGQLRPGDVVRFAVA